MSSISVDEKIAKMKANKKLTVKTMKAMIKETMKVKTYRGYSTKNRNGLIELIANNRKDFPTFHKSLEKGTINEEIAKKLAPKKAPPKKPASPKKAPPKKPAPKKQAPKKQPSKNKEIKKLEKELKELQNELKEAEDSEDEEIIKGSIKDIKGDLKELKKGSKK